ncbi:MAG: hypothetical protein ACM3XO_11445 [Bacteroidota bacterium]
MRSRKWLLLIGIILVIVSGISGLVVRKSLAAAGSYKVLAWNDLGMHCYSRDFADMAVLPPYNTLWVQVLKAGDPPEVVTSGITVEYSYADNTYSAGKTNFWNYDQALFGVNLPLNVGLKGKGLSGTMDLSGDHFIAEGIPITEFSDSAPTVRQPYQLATVVVKDATTGAVLASNQVVTPTSSEMRCDNCHGDTGIAKPSVPTGKVETNILQLHDENTGTTLMASRPVLCASCHGSNALGMPGKPGIKNLSNAMHTQHASVVPSTLAGCYNCHPGPQTRCLRDVMSTDEGMTCVSCHGGLANVANNSNPWLNEPRCDSCHNSGEYHQNQALYRFSTGHGGLYCEACHDSTHAIAPSREANDAIKFTQLQGQNGPLENCSVCHTVTPAQGWVHNLMPVSISGNTGTGWVTLSYTDGTPKTAAADANGNYSFTVSYGWSGTVTPSRTGFTFSPASKTYNNVTADQTSQNYTAGWVGGVSVTSDKNIVTVARPHIGAEVASYDGFATGSLTSYVPMLFKKAYGTYDSALYVQNVHASNTANITIKYYNSNGGLDCTRNDIIAPLSSKGYWVPTETCTTGSLPNGWVGGAVVTSDQPIVAVGRPHVGAEVMTYNGFGGGSLTSYIPMLFKGAFGGSYNSAFYIQNVNASNPATITIKYYDSEGVLKCTKGDTINPLASKGYWVPTATCDTGSIPPGWIGGVIVSSSQPIVGVGRPHIGTQVTTYDGFTAGGSSSYIPMLFKGAFDGSYNAAFYLQNTDTANTANITIKYYSSTGNLDCTKTDTILPLASKGYWLPSETCTTGSLPASWVGGVIVTSDRLIVGVGRPHIGAQVTTYNGFANGSLNSFLPMLFKDAFGGSYDSAFYIQNTENSSATVTVKLYDTNGALACTHQDTLPALSTLGYWVPTMTCAP